MEADQGRQADREKELVDELSKKQRRVGELEMEVLSLTQKIVRMDADHVHRMREVQEELERYKVCSLGMAEVGVAMCRY